MPNWCEGSLKIRGKIANLKNFVLHGLKPVPWNPFSLHSEGTDSLSFEDESDTSFGIYNIKTILWLDGSRRHFCEPDDIEIYADDPEIPTVMVLPFKAAWVIDSGDLQYLCKRFDVDMKIQAFEMGAQFSQIIEIVNGEILQDQEIEYDNWDWDCPCPRMGG